jgi:hypothetical protein
MWGLFLRCWLWKMNILIYEMGLGVDELWFICTCSFFSNGSERMSSCWCRPWNQTLIFMVKIKLFKVARPLKLCTLLYIYYWFSPWRRTHEFLVFSVLYLQGHIETICFGTWPLRPGYLLSTENFHLLILFESFLSQLGTTHCSKKYFFLLCQLHKGEKNIRSWIHSKKNLMCRKQHSYSYTRIMNVFCFL